MGKADVLAFADRAEEHLLDLAADLSLLRHREVSRGQVHFSSEENMYPTPYLHGQYTRFVVCDPKRREIAKASVRDRVLHHAIHRILAPLFDRSFIHDSYSSRKGKGTHAAGKRFRTFAWRLSRNHTKTVWVLQLDVRRFFDSVDHEVLLLLLRNRLLKIQVSSFFCHPREGGDPGSTRQVTGSDGFKLKKYWIPGHPPVPNGYVRAGVRDDKNGSGAENEILLRAQGDEKELLHLLGIIVRSFETVSGKGIPLGNLTSQLFSNVYLDPLDQFVKRTLRVKHYLRYADDMTILSRDREYLEECRDRIAEFLARELRLELHPDKMTIGRWHEGIDVLGYVHFPFHAVLRTKTKRRMMQKLFLKKETCPEDEERETSFACTRQSYLGLLKHCRGRALERNLPS